MGDLNGRTRERRRRPPSSKGNRHFDFARKRLREIEQIIADRYGVLPDTDDADAFLDPVASCHFDMFWRRKRRPPNFDELLDRLNLWCDGRARDVSFKLRRDAAREALRRRRLESADECAVRLRLSYEERTRLRITTIGAYDADKKERERRRRLRKLVRDRRRAIRKRSERGAVPRAVYLANCLSVARPWSHEGISRRTWERRRQRPPRGVVASPSPISSDFRAGDTPETPVAESEEHSPVARPLPSRRLTQSQNE